MLEMYKLHLQLRQQNLAALADIKQKPAPEKLAQSIQNCLRVHELISESDDAIALWLQRQEMHYLQITVTGDDEGNSDKQYLRLIALSKDSVLALQSAFEIPCESQFLPLPSKCKGHAIVSASLTLRSGHNVECSSTLELVDGCERQWLQIGVDPYGLRVQLQIFALGTGYHITHARVTPPCTPDP